VAFPDCFRKEARPASLASHDRSPASRHCNLASHDRSLASPRTTAASPNCSPALAGAMTTTRRMANRVEAAANASSRLAGVDVTRGLLAGFVAAFFAGAPTMLWYLLTMPSVDVWVDRYVLQSLTAAGNVFLPEKQYTNQTLMIAGAVTHLALSLSWGVALSVATRNVRDPAYTVLACVLLAVGIHYFDLLVVPVFWPMPKMNEFIISTGLLAHLLDHIAFGATAGGVLAALKSGKYRSWFPDLAAPGVAGAGGPAPAAVAVGGDAKAD